MGAIDLTGHVYGRLAVLRRAGTSANYEALWECRCSCGNTETKTVRAAHLRRGAIQSCGCIRACAQRQSGTVIYSMFSNARSRARKKGLPFELELSDITIPVICPLLGILLQPAHNKRPAPNSPSLDRIIPSLGYVKGNVWIISHKANTIKSNASLVELERICRGLRRTAKHKKTGG